MIPHDNLAGDPWGNGRSAFEGGVVVEMEILAFACD
jgi:hypothetical protein